MWNEGTPCPSFQCFWMYSFFALCNWFGFLRLNLEQEAVGLDQSAMGSQTGNTVDIDVTMTKVCDLKL